jgi:chromate reductase
MAELPEGGSMEIADLSAMPFYNVDLPERPAAVQRLMACPECNYSIAPALKNALDWISREPDNALIAGKSAAIMGPAAAWALRAPSTTCASFSICTW